MKTDHKLKKEIVLAVLTIIITVALFYLGTAFIKFDLNASNWDSVERSIVVVFGLPFGICLAGIVFTIS